MRLHDKGRPPPKKPISYAEALGSALRQEFGDRRFAVKTVGRWTGAFDRTIKNWFAGAALPTGHHLIALVAHSDAALETVLAASRRVDLLEAFFALRRVSRNSTAWNEKPKDVPDHVTLDGPARVPDRGAMREAGSIELRCRWFVAGLLAGERIDASDLSRRFDTSVRTAKRDIALMRTVGTIRYEGTTRRGRYVLCQPIAAEDRRKACPEHIVTAKGRAPMQSCKR